MTQSQHPTIVLPFTRHWDLLAVIRFMYCGEINITQTELPGLLACAESLQIKGLAKINPHKASEMLLSQEAAVQQNHSSDHFRLKLERPAAMDLCDDGDAVEITENENLVVDEGTEISAIRYPFVKYIPSNRVTFANRCNFGHHNY